MDVDIAGELDRVVRHLTGQISEAVRLRRRSEIVVRFDETGRVVGDKVVSTRGR